MVYTINYIGMVHDSEGRLSLALENYFKAESIAIKFNHKLALFGIWNNIANQFCTIKDKWNECVEYRKKAYALSIQLDIPLHIFTTGKTLGITLCKLNRATDGMFILQKIYPIGVKMKHPDIKEIENEIQRCILSKL